MAVVCSGNMHSMRMYAITHSHPRHQASPLPPIFHFISILRAFVSSASTKMLQVLYEEASWLQTPPGVEPVFLGVQYDGTVFGASFFHLQWLQPFSYKWLHAMQWWYNLWWYNGWYNTTSWAPQNHSTHPSILPPTFCPRIQLLQASPCAAIPIFLPKSRRLPPHAAVAHA